MSESRKRVIIRSNSRVIPSSILTSKLQFFALSLFFMKNIKKKYCICKTNKTKLYSIPANLFIEHLRIPQGARKGPQKNSKTTIILRKRTDRHNHSFKKSHKTRPLSS